MQGTRDQSESFHQELAQRAFRWRRLLEDGRYALVSDITRPEKTDRAYAGDILRLTLLALTIVVKSRQPAGMTLPALMKGFTAAWERQIGYPMRTDEI